MTDKLKPTQFDHFWEIRKLVDEWNNNMTNQFSPSWVVCLDESMSKWINKWACPGFICIPRKPWPFGNEWHTIACGKSGILFFVELVKGQDRPAWMGNKKYDEKGGPTVGLMLRMTEPIWHSSRVVVMDSGFCVLLGVIELKKKGLFGTALIKK